MTETTACASRGLIGTTLTLAADIRLINYGMINGLNMIRAQLLRNLSKFYEAAKCRTLGGGPRRMTNPPCASKWCVIGGMSDLDSSLAFWRRMTRNDRHSLVIRQKL